MMPALGKCLRALALALTVLAIAAGCSSSAPAASTSGGGSAASQAAASQGGSVASQAGATQAAATQAPASQAAVGGSDLGTYKPKFDNITSYKFRMELAGGSFDQIGQLVGGGSSFVVTGTVVTKPTKAASMEIGGWKIVEIGNKQWMDMGMGSWLSSDVTGDSMADSLSPEKMFSSYVSGSTAADYKAAGEGEKNGVHALKFVAASDIMNEYGDLFGIEGTAKWTCEVWIAKDGGYPVNTTVIASQNGKDAFKLVFDMTNVNDPANTVVAPA